MAFKSDEQPAGSQPESSSPDSRQGAPKGSWLPATASFLATGLGIGLKLPAPGTFGSLWGIPIWLLVLQLPSFSWQIGALALFFLLGIPACTLAARDLYARGLTKKAKDPGAIVWDEFATVPMVYAFAPAATSCFAGCFAAGAPALSASALSAGILWLAIGFGLHRLFDISKPWPCHALEELPDGLGVMIDDLAAAFYAGLVYSALWYFYGG